MPEDPNPAPRRSKDAEDEAPPVHPGCDGGALPPGAIAARLLRLADRILEEAREAYPAVTDAAAEEFARIRVDALQNAVTTLDWLPPFRPAPGAPGVGAPVDPGADDPFPEPPPDPLRGAPLGGPALSAPDAAAPSDDPTDWTEHSDAYVFW